MLKSFLFLLLSISIFPSMAAAQEAGPRPSLAADEANPSLMAGLQKMTINVDGRERVYFVHKPAGLKTPAPVLFELHGGRGTAPRRAAQTGFNEIADRDRFIAIYPQGFNYRWNDGRQGSGSQPGEVDDVAFFRAVFARLIADRDGDPKRFYVVGGSNGGMMTQRLACELTDKIAAATAIVSSMPEPIAPVCKPSRPIPFMMMNGTADPLVLFGGGVVAKQPQNGRTIPVMQTVEFWRASNGCPAEPRRSQVPDRDPADGMRTDTFIWGPCKGGSELTFFRMNGAGHGLPGRSKVKSGEAEREGGKSSNDFDSSEEAWAFMRRFTLP